jgi:hypothetical protein
VSGEEVEKAFSNNDNRFVGIDLPEGTVLRDVIMQMDSVYKSNRELFDRSRIYGAVNRITGISEIMRGEQLRTNTTEDAANLMADAASTRIDEKNDKIEEEIADIVQFLLEVCVQKAKPAGGRRACGF